MLFRSDGSWLHWHHQHGPAHGLSAYVWLYKPLQVVQCDDIAARGDLRGGAIHKVWSATVDGAACGRDYPADTGRQARAMTASTSSRRMSTEYPMGRYHLTFTAIERRGLLLLHASGDTFIRDLADGESVLVRPTSLLYWEDKTDLSLHLEYAYVPGKPTRRTLSRYRTIWLRLRGPGRVAVQSAYEHVEDAGVPDYSSFASWHRWPAPSTTTRPE